MFYCYAHNQLILLMILAGLEGSQRVYDGWQYVRNKAQGQAEKASQPLYDTYLIFGNTIPSKVLSTGPFGVATKIVIWSAASSST